MHHLVVPPNWSESDPLQNVTRISYVFCNVTLAEDLFKPPPFQASNRLERTNEIAIRFGGSNNMMTLFEGTDEQVQDYIIGLVGSSILMATFFCIWCIVLVILQCQSNGYQRYGFLCGRFVVPIQTFPTASNVPSSDRKEQEQKEVEKEVQTEEEEKHEKSFSNGQEVPTQSFYKEESSTGSRENTTESVLNNSGQEEEGQEAEIQEDPNDSEAVHLEDDPPDELPDMVGHPTPPTSSSLIIDNSTDTCNDKNTDLSLIEACQRQERRFWRTRQVLVLSCVGVVVSGILFCVYGDKYVRQSLDTVKEGLLGIQDLCLGGVTLIDNFVNRSQAVVDRNEAFFPQINGVCPEVRQELCTSIVNDTDFVPIRNCTVHDIPFVNESLAKVLEIVYETREYIFDEVNEWRDDFINLYDDIETFLNGESMLEWAFWLSFSFTIVLLVCGAWMLGGMYYNSTRRRENNQNGRRREYVLRHRILFPLFCSLVVFAFAFSVAFVIAAIAASDWCINSPNPKTTYILDSNLEKLGSLVYQWAKYYVNQCDDSLFPIQLNNRTDQLLAILDTIQGLGKMYSPSTPQNGRKYVGETHFPCRILPFWSELTCVCLL